MGKTLYKVSVRTIEPWQDAGSTYSFPASNPHYAVRQVVEQHARAGRLPRGWKQLEVRVAR